DWESATDYYSQVLQMQQDSRFQSWISNSPSTLTLLQEWANAPYIQRTNIPQGVCDSTLTWLKNSNLQDNNYCDLSELLGSQNLENWKQTHPKPNQCGGLDCEPCLKGVFKYFQWQNLGQGIQKALMSKNNTTSTPLFVAVIPNGRAWIVPQQNYWLVCKAIAIITPDNQLLADVSREYPAPLPGCPSYDAQQHQVFQEEQLPPLQQIEGRVAVLSGLSGNVYFHWMVDVLPRLELLRQSGIKFEQLDWFLVNSYQAPFQRETLTRLGIPEFKILESDRFPHIQAQQLIVPSWAGYMGWLQPWAMDTLRRWFLPKSQNPGRNYPERIYISRGDANYRRVLNEDEVIQFLRPWGFVTVQLETLSFGEQVALFAQAKVIMGAHGSGLTNILFCQPGTQVIEFMSPHYNRHYYWVISQYLGLEHYCLKAEGFSCYPLRALMYQNPLTEDIWLNLVSLKRLLEILFVRKQAKPGVVPASSLPKSAINN
ncbi:MAG: glycosyltransferase family 61 protein, partial [Planktothrix sp.]